MHQYTQGKNTRQGHKGIPDGLFEEEQGQDGFFGNVSHLLRRKPSTSWLNIEGPLKPRLYDLVKCSQSESKQRLFYNDQVNVYLEWKEKSAIANLKAYRSADGDLLYFCHKGKGEFFTEYGILSYQRGHYIVVPKNIAHAINAGEKSNFFVIENLTSHYKEPSRGIVGRHALYDTNAIGKPNLELQIQKLLENKNPIREIEVKHAGEITKFTHGDTVFDVVGWKGDLFPYTLHMDHIMPLMSHRAHLPPSAHSTFVARDFVVCTFLPRPLEMDEDALKVPFYHQNMDYDEVLFYHDGDFFSRDNLHAGMLSFHPAGFPHGPHPKAVKNIKTKTETNEYAVMLDTRCPLKRDSFMEEVEVKEYWKSWKE